MKRADVGGCRRPVAAPPVAPRRRGGCTRMPPARPDRWNGLGSLRPLTASTDSHGISVTDFYLIGSTRLAGVEGGTFGPCRQSRSSGRVLCNPELKCSYLSFGEESSMGSRNSCRPDLKILVPAYGTREGKGLIHNTQSRQKSRFNTGTALF